MAAGPGVVSLEGRGAGRPPVVEKIAIARKLTLPDSPSAETGVQTNNGIEEDIGMAVPKRRQSNARTGSRRAHDFKKPRELMFCQQCSTAVPPHVVCPKCGHYMGRNVVKMD